MTATADAVVIGGGVMGLCIASFLQQQGPRVTDVLVDGDRVTGVETADGGQITSPVVINAGGPWAGLLCARMGLDLPLGVIRPEQAYFVAPPGAAGTSTETC